ncbi:hypothetical protein [Nocardia abscessus]|uniref:hypothetical protein n=1 Tax=Nocardia abscessus TaxID=120957 RepID=UPI000316F899|nr:hypothetical protein [Nocardia abscessus]MCC3326993.1 hypothetical protein [Nocardia abscessus]
MYAPAAPPIAMPPSTPTIRLTGRLMQQQSAGGDPDDEAHDGSADAGRGMGIVPLGLF